MPRADVEVEAFRRTEVPTAALLCGAGFLCDVMGLGKTLETLMLVVANPAPAGWAVADVAGRSRQRDGDPVPIKTTLIVMPANLLSQWQDELQLHVKPDALTWCAEHTLPQPRHSLLRTAGTSLS